MTNGKRFVCMLLFAMISTGVLTEQSDADQQTIPKGFSPDTTPVERGPVTAAPATMTVSQPACHSQADLDKVIQFGTVKDGHGAYTFLTERMAASECVILMLGESVGIDPAADISDRICVWLEGSQFCFWTLSNGVDQNRD
jgi:hypothetical protein